MGEEVKLAKPKKNTTLPVKDVVAPNLYNELTRENVCPYCLSDKDADGEDKKVVANHTLVKTKTSWQCGECGKEWKDNQFGKPYTLALERGDAWVREQESRRIR